MSMVTKAVVDVGPLWFANSGLKSAAFKDSNSEGNHRSKMHAFRHFGWWVAAVGVFGVPSQSGDALRFHRSPKKQVSSKSLMAFPSWR